MIIDSHRKYTVRYEEPTNIKFDQLFIDILFGYVSFKEGKPERPCYIHGSNYQMPSIGHAGLVKHATQYFVENTPKDVDPIDYFSGILSRGRSSLLPNPQNSVIPIPPFKLTSKSSEAELREYYNWLDDNHLHVIQDKNGWTRLLDIHPMDYNRAFGQLMSAVINASHVRCYDKPLRVSGFDEKRDFFPEGLERGVLVIDGSVGRHCGKHSSGGTIIINGNAGEYLGDSADNTNFYIKGDVDLVSAGRDCKVIICGKEKDKTNPARYVHETAQIYEGEVAKKLFDEEMNRLGIR